MKLTFTRVSFVRFIFAFFMCGNLLVSTSCVKQSASLQSKNIGDPTNTAIVNRPVVNINNATRQALETLPGIGPGLAMRIIEHRERYGRFRRAEHLIMVRGLSDRRFREMQSIVVVE